MAHGSRSKTCIPTGADAQFGAGREIEITLEKPYRKEPPPQLNRFGIPAKSKYRTADVCAVLRISPDVLRWRSLQGKYPRVKRDGRGRIFTLEDIESMLANPPTIDKQRSEAGKKSRQGKPSAMRNTPDEKAVTGNKSSIRQHITARMIRLSNFILNIVQAIDYLIMAFTALFYPHL